MRPALRFRGSARAAAAAVGVLLSFLVQPPAPAGPAAGGQGVACGATIVQSTRLTHNLTCTGTALTLGAPLGATVQPITVDLGGHSISSTSPPKRGFLCGVASPALVIQGVGLTVENGRISVPPATSLPPATSAGAVAVCDLGRTIAARGLTVNGGGWQEGGGDDNALTLSDSLFLDGAWFGSNENAASLTGNRFLDGPATAPPAISVGLNDGTFTDNLITGYSTGMALGGFIELGLVQGNVVAHSGTGIEVDQIGVGTIRGNLLVGNRADGLLVEPDAAAAPGAVEDNIAAMNGGDGIALALNPGASSGSWAATVSANLAIGNGGYGIDSPGTQPRVAVTDGGGNMAFGNGSPGQCRDIASAP